MVRVIAGLPTVLVYVTVALRATVVGFGSAVITTVSLPLPVVGVTDNQLLAVQVPATRQSVLEDTVMVWLPPAGPDGFQTVVGVTVKMAVTPAWVTVKDRTTAGLTDVVLNSITPVRGAVEVFA